MGKKVNTREVRERKKCWRGRMEKTSKLVEELQGTKVKGGKG